jgi:hypothetical protein
MLIILRLRRLEYRPVARRLVSELVALEIVVTSITLYFTRDIYPNYIIFKEYFQK